MRRTSILAVACLGLMACVGPGAVGKGDSSSEAAAAPASPLQGAWRLVEVWGSDSTTGEWRTTAVQPSVYLFMDGFYSIAYVGGNERRPQMKEGATRQGLTAAEAASVWIPYVSNSGRYEVAGDQLTTRPIVALWPNFMEGDSASYTFAMEGERLHLWSSGEGSTWHARLERLQ